MKLIIKILIDKEVIFKKENSFSYINFILLSYFFSDKQKKDLAVDFIRNFLTLAQVHI